MPFSGVRVMCRCVDIPQKGDFAGQCGPIWLYSYKDMHAGKIEIIEVTILLYMHAHDCKVFVRSTTYNCKARHYVSNARHTAKPHAWVWQYVCMAGGHCTHACMSIRDR